MARLKVLQVAFTASPEGHGEHWLGWEWAAQAARFCELHLVTTPWWRDAVERHAEAAGVRVHFVSAPPLITGPRGPIGGVEMWAAQYLWQHRAARRAAELHAREGFAVVHQTTFHTFRVPFRSAFLGLPAVWGPIAGGESVPPGFGDLLGPARHMEALRPVLNRLCLASPAVRRSLRVARRLFVSNETTLRFLPAWSREKSRIVPPNAFRGDLPPLVARLGNRGGPLRLLYAGNCVATRSIPLVLRAMRAVPELDCRLSLAGTGPALAEWEREIARSGLGEKVTLHGHVSREKLAELYRAADALVFPGLRDSGGSALLEAMSLGLPVVCLDWGGPAEMVDAESGVKISVASPALAIEGFAAAFRRLHAEPAWAAGIGLAGARRCRLFTWEAKRAMLEETYREVATV